VPTHWVVTAAADDVPLVEPSLEENFERVLEWADELRRLSVRANADTPTDAPADPPAGLAREKEQRLLAAWRERSPE